jgi:anti-anti-sigma factor
MKIAHTSHEGTCEVVVDGRLDGYWADHLDRAVTDLVRHGHHRITLDCSKLSFISSAGIAVLMKFRKELLRINGVFQVVNPSTSVTNALKMTRLLDLLVSAAPPAPAAPVASEPEVRRIEREQTGFNIHDLDARARLTGRVAGRANPLANDPFDDEDPSVSLASLSPTFAVGIGAFGDSFSDCRTRFGEMVSVAGATAYQPADGTNVPDYLVASGGAQASDVHVLSCLSCAGSFSHLVRFDTLRPGGTIGLSHLLATCLEAVEMTYLDVVEAPAIGFVMVAETAGLVGAALRRSPAERFEDASFFTHPGICQRLSFTAEPAFARGVTLAAGVVSRSALESGTGGWDLDAQLRPMGAGCVGHVHAAAFHFRPIKKGRIDLGETVSGLFEPDQLMGVLHLLNDDRPGGAGESEFVRGACWIAPLSGT